MESTTRRERPAGISNIATLLALAGIIDLILGIIFLTRLFSGSMPLNFWVILSGIDAIAAPILLVVAWGLWTLKPWSIRWAIGIEIVNLALHLLLILFHRDNVNVAGNVFAMIIAVVVLVYLYRSPKVRELSRI